MKRSSAVLLALVLSCLLLSCAVTGASANGRQGAAEGEVTSADPAQQWHFAEGNTLPDFQEYICVLNPNDRAVKLWFNFILDAGGQLPTVESVLAAHCRGTYNVKDMVHPNVAGVSLLLYCPDAGVVAERSMYFRYTDVAGQNVWTGGSTTMGINDLQQSWYFAEGTTRYNGTDGMFNEWLCLQNPYEFDAYAHITFMLGTGPNKTLDYVVPRLSRQTVNVADQVGYNQDVSIKITSDVPLAAERPLYFDYHNSIQDGTCAFGVAGPSKSWYFAEGTTRTGYQEWITLQNPDAADATVTLTYFTGSGKAITTTKTVPAGCRYTVDVIGDVGADRDVSTQIVSDRGVVAERPMYFKTDRYSGGSDVVGSTRLGTTSYLAEGTTIPGFDTWYAIGNPGTVPANVSVTYMFSDGSSTEREYAVQPRSRLTVMVNAVVGFGKDVSARFVSDAPVVVERPVYYDYNGIKGGDSVTSYIVD